MSGDIRVFCAFVRGRRGGLLYGFGKTARLRLRLRNASKSKTTRNYFLAPCTPCLPHDQNNTRHQPRKRTINNALLVFWCGRSTLGSKHAPMAPPSAQTLAARAPFSLLPFRFRTHFLRRAAWKKIQQPRVHERGGRPAAGQSHHPRVHGQSRQGGQRAGDPKHECHVRPAGDAGGRHGADVPMICPSCQLGCCCCSRTVHRSAWNLVRSASRRIYLSGLANTVSDHHEERGHACDL